MKTQFSRRLFFKGNAVMLLGWLARRFLPEGEAAQKRPGPVDLPEQMDPERLALWKRSPRLPVLASEDAVTSRLLRAIREERTIDFSYYGPAAGHATVRTICPGTVFTVEGFEATYVSGYCFARRQERTFCIERMTLPS